MSTKRQGASGLGLEAQRKAIDNYAASKCAEVIARFNRSDRRHAARERQACRRPELAKALHLAKVTGAMLLIAKLDRLSRNAAFLLTLRDSGVRFVAADMPEAKDLTVGIMALVAEQEREAISRRTRGGAGGREGARGRIGNPNGAAALRRAGKGGRPLRESIARNAERHAENLRAVVDDVRTGGHISLRAIAAELNARGWPPRSA